MWYYLNPLLLLLRNKQIGDLDEEYSKIASYDSDQNFSLDTSNKTAEDKSSLLLSNLETSDNIKTIKQASCRINKPSEILIESKNIHVEKDFGFRNWCTFSTKRNDLRYFVINDSQQSSIISIGNQTINPNDSSSSDIILNTENSTSTEILNSKDQSAIRYYSITKYIPVSKIRSPIHNFLKLER